MWKEAERRKTFKYSTASGQWWLRRLTYYFITWILPNGSQKRLLFKCLRILFNKFAQSVGVKSSRGFNMWKFSVAYAAIQKHELWERFESIVEENIQDDSFVCILFSLAACLRVEKLECCRKRWMKKKAEKAIHGWRIINMIKCWRFQRDVCIAAWLQKFSLFFCCLLF